MPRPISLLVLPLALSSLLVQAQTAPQLASVLERLDRLERENRSLTEQVQALRGELAAFRGETPTASSGTTTNANETPSSPASAEQRLDIQEHRLDEQAQSKVETTQKFPIRLTGMALFNAFADSKQSGGSDYPLVAAAPGPRHAGATVRQSILGLEFRGPQTFWGGHVRGSVYMDFSSGNAPLSQTMRLRTGEIEVDWPTHSLMAGIEKPIFNPREPSSLAQVGVSPLTGAGNLWLWMPQVRLEQDFKLASQSGVRAQLGVVQTREVGPYAGSLAGTNLEASRPGVEGRFELFHNFDDERKLEIAPGFHMSTTHVSGFSVPSQVLSFDWFVKPVRWLEFTGAFYHGQNVSELGSGYRQGYDIDPQGADAVRSQGGWGQVTIHATRRVDFHLFSGQQDDRNSDLLAGNIGKNWMFGGNLYFRIAPNVLMGPEVSQLRTVYLGQGTRRNNHYDLALAYLF